MTPIGTGTAFASPNQVNSHCSTSHRLIRIASALLISLLCANVQAQISSFKLIGATPARGGATLHLTFQNWWGNAEKTRLNKDVHLSLHTQRPANGVESGSSVKLIGTFEMLGSQNQGIGTLDVGLNYKQLGCKAGQQIWLHGRWATSNHGWGEPWAYCGRSAGTLTLPAPLQP